MFATIIFLSSMNYLKFVHLEIKTFLIISHSFRIQVIFLNCKVNIFIFSFVHAPECAYCKIGKLVNCEFICLSFSFVHTPVCANCKYFL